jgi:hypothetical protein
LKRRIRLGLCRVGPGSGVIGESGILLNLRSHPARFFRRLSSGLFSSRQPRLVFLARVQLSAPEPGHSQILFIKPDPVGYQIPFSISNSLGLQTQTAHDVGHGVVLLAPETSAVRSDVRVGRQEHYGLGAVRGPHLNESPLRMLTTPWTFCF